MDRFFYSECGHTVGDETKVRKLTTGKCPQCKNVKSETISGDEGDTIINFGGDVKATSDGHVTGYLVQFGSADKPDDSAMRDYFTPETDFGFKKGEKIKSPVWFHHTLPIKTKNSGTVRFSEIIGESTLEIDENGVLIDAIITNTKYKDALISNYKALGWSSGVAGHLTERVKTGNAHRVTRWILGSDASLTPNPADKRNRAGVLSVKSLQEEEVEFEIEVKLQDISTTTPQSAGEGVTNMEEQKIQNLVAESIKAAFAEKEKAEAAVKAAEEKTKLDAENRKKEIDEAVKSALEAARGGASKPAGEKGANINTKTGLGDDPFKAMRHWLKTGDPGGIRADVEAYKEAGVGFGSDMKTTYALVEGTQYQGQEVVPTEVAAKIYTRRDTISIARAAGAQVLQVGSNAITLPIEKNNPEKFVLTAEAGTFDQLTQQPLDKASVTIYNFTKSVPISTQLLEDSVANLEDWWMQRLARSIGLTENYYLVSVGTGSGQPQSALVGSTLGVTAASQTVVTVGEVISLYHALPAQYRDNVSWVMKIGRAHV